MPWHILCYSNPIANDNEIFCNGVQMSSVRVPGKLSERWEALRALA